MKRLKSGHCMISSACIEIHYIMVEIATMDDPSLVEECQAIAETYNTEKEVKEVLDWFVETGILTDGGRQILESLYLLTYAEYSIEVD